MSAAGVAALILAVALVVVVVVSALWIRSRGKSIARGLVKIRSLENKVAALHRAAAVGAEAERIKGLSDDQVLAELLDHPARFDGGG